MSEQGIVKWFDVSKRFGFIAPSGGGKDIFFHGSVLSDIDSDAMDGGGEGIAVNFERGEYRGRPCGTNVRIADDEGIGNQ
jgi:cold shock protein